MNQDRPEPLSHSFPDSLRTLSLPPGRSVGLSTKPPPKDWPHAPVHRLSENAVYIVTAGTLNKNHLFCTDAKRDLLERMLLSGASSMAGNWKHGRSWPITIILWHGQSALHQ